jgi:hypothetical protein
MVPEAFMLSNLSQNFRFASKASTIALLLSTASAPAKANTLVVDMALSAQFMTLITSGSLCITYEYDANGNRTSQSTFTFGTPAAVWGSGIFGCFNYTS